ncbi:hypothetical protein HK405_010028 [Cladochytrium tenue]|nr:hypothetical protein HK405_010028 [Cladochytrium tenue]
MASDAAAADHTATERVLLVQQPGDAAFAASIEREREEADLAYFLPSDAGERRRLQMQHIVLRHLFSGLLFQTPQQALFENPDAAAKVLDIGCGPGSWTIDMADPILYEHQHLPSNLVFQKENVLEGLSCYFDEEQPGKSRPVTSGPYKELFSPLSRILKANGVDYNLEENLTGLCTAAGLKDVQERFAVAPVGWNGPIGGLAAADIKQLATGASKPLLKGARDDAAYDQLVADAFKQAAEEKLFTIIICVTGRV